VVALALFVSAVPCEAVSGNPRALVRKAGRLVKKGDLDGAKAIYDEAIRLDPEYAEAYLQRGRIHLVTGEPKSAESDFSRVIDLDPEAAEAYYLRSRVRRASGQLERAREDLSVYIEAVPGNPKALIERAQASYFLGDYDSALRDLDLSMRDCVSEIREIKKVLSPLGATELTKLTDIPLVVNKTSSGVVDPSVSAALIMTATEDRAGMAARQKAAMKAFEQRVNMVRKIRMLRGKVHARKGDREQALVEFGKAMGRYDSDAEAGVFYYVINDLGEARAALEVASIDGVKEAHVPFFLILARARTSDRESVCLALQTESAGRARSFRGEWPEPIGRFLCGEIKEEEFFAIAARGDPEAIATQQRQALYYASQSRLIAGDAAGAFGLLKGCYEFKSAEIPESMAAGIQIVLTWLDAKGKGGGEGEDKGESGRRVGMEVSESEQ
jgi:tetratricopeptide (TPR) repeat protein